MRCSIEPRSSRGSAIETVIISSDNRPQSELNKPADHLPAATSGRLVAPKKRNPFEYHEAPSSVKQALSMPGLLAMFDSAVNLVDDRENKNRPSFGA